MNVKQKDWAAAKKGGQRGPTKKQSVEGLGGGKKRREGNGPASKRV